MFLNDETTWPPSIVEYLESHRDLFAEWERRRCDSARATKPDIGSLEVVRERVAEYERASADLRSILGSYELRGYHCTRLTDAEIDHIKNNGMQLPDLAMLCRRIDALQNAQLMEPHIADRLRKENQADDRNRAGIWFCFFQPHLDPSGIQRFFRSWGGEALYNLHESDPLTGPVLRTIGTPCVIEADVPIASLGMGLEDKVARQFLANRGLETPGPCDHEDYVTSPIAVQNIRRIVREPDPAFIELTGCHRWTPPPEPDPEASARAQAAVKKVQELSRIPGMRRLMEKLSARSEDWRNDPEIQTLLKMVEENRDDSSGFGKDETQN